MRSPFPGMDPYLERYWRDVHTTVIVHARRALQSQLGGGLKARVDERLIVEMPTDESRFIYPDVRIFEHGQPRRPITPGGVAVAEPLIVKHASDKAHQRFIEIIDTASGGRLVTVIELLSPSNKFAGDGREQYQQKQEEIIAGGINLVEIDLTRSGRRQLAFPAVELPESHRTTYLACVYRASPSDQFEIYRMPLREPLPAMRIPLREGDPDAVLDLQTLINLAYEDGDFDDIDYSKPCSPQLDAADAAWADGVLREAGKR